MANFLLELELLVAALLEAPPPGRGLVDPEDDGTKSPFDGFRFDIMVFSIVFVNEHLKLLLLVGVARRY